MNSAEYVDQQIQILKTSGIPMTDAAWEAAKLCVGWPYIFGAVGQLCTIAYRKQVSGRGTEAKYQNVRKKCQAIRSSNPTGSCSGCKWYPGGKRVRSYDCRGFTRWILQQIYGWTLQGGGATSQWNNADNWTAKGSIDSIPENTLVCLFYPSEKDPKVMEHTGLGYKGETVECSAGVQWKKQRDPKWTHWALPKCVSGEVPVPDPDKKPTLRKGDQGPYVVELQTDLVRLGFDLGKYGPDKNGIDGKFGQKTEDAVKGFQKNHDGPDGKALAVDGVVGKDTWWAIEQAMGTEPGPEPEPEPPKEQLYTVTIPHVSLAQAEELCVMWSGATMEKE